MIQHMKKQMLLFLLLPLSVLGQQTEPLTLDKAYELARNNYPLIKQQDLIRQTRDLTIDNLSTGFLPQVTLSGQATWQSEVTQIKIPIPGFSVTPPNKDQYKVLADISQLIYDGGVIREQKNIQQLAEKNEQQKLEVELYKLKDRINQLFMGVLYMDEQIKQVDLVKSDINTGIKKVEAQVENGVAFRSSLNVLKAELLKTNQRASELKATRKGLIDVLSLLINTPLPDNLVLVKPVPAAVMNANTVNRPEINLYRSQSALFNSQLKLINARNKPKAGLFMQGGYGRPGLNFLNNDFSFYYTGGLRLSWSLSGLYTKKKEQKLTALNIATVKLQEETFLLNTNSQLKQQQAEINRLQQLVDTDQEIIDLRISIKDAAKAQLENGVITSNDYLREVNAEDQARQTLITHQLQLLQAKINYQTISGNQ